MTAMATRSFTQTAVPAVEIEAPRGQIQVAGPTNKIIVGLKRYKTEGGSLVYTQRGDALTPGSVSPLLYLQHSHQSRL